MTTSTPTGNSWLLAKAEVDLDKFIKNRTSRKDVAFPKYIREKLKIFRRDFTMTPTFKEIDELCNKTSMTAIDNFMQKMITNRLDGIVDYKGMPKEK